MISALGVAVALAATVPPAPEGARMRPELSGPELILDSDDGFFRVHYTLEGADRPASTDAAARAVVALQEARERYEASGYRALIPDDGRGGSDAIDLYLWTVDINGYAHGVEVDEGDSRGSCWMEVDASLASAGVVLESVVHHELFHCVQYRYTWESHSWMYESGATYEQYLGPTDAGLDLALGVLYDTRLGNPDLNIDNLSGRYEYAGFLFVKFWIEAEDTDRDRLRQTWEALADEPDWRIVLDDEAQRIWDRSFDDLFLDHATWNAFACARDDGQHYDPDTLACIGAAQVPVEEVDGPELVVQHDRATHTALYYEIPAGGDAQPVELSCSGPGEGATVGARLVATDADGVSGEEATTWASGTEPFEVRLRGRMDPDGSAVAVFASTGDEPADLVCGAERVAPALCGCQTTGGFSGVWVLAWLPLARRRRVA